MTLPAKTIDTGSSTMNSQEWVSIMEACVIVGVSRRTIYNWMEKGLLETQRTAGGAVRIKRISLWRADPEHRQLPNV